MSFLKTLAGTALGGVTGGLLTSGAFGDMLGNLDGSNERRAAREQGRLADGEMARARDFEGQQLAASQRFVGEQGGRLGAIQERLDARQGVNEDAMQGAIDDMDPESASRRAAGEFGAEYDAASADARRRSMGYGIQPGSTTAARSDRLGAFDRARGAASAGNQARTAEGDAQFLRRATMMDRGDRLQGRVLDGYQNLYGTEYNALGGAAQGAIRAGGYHQGISNAQAQASGAGLGAIASLAGTVGGAVLGGPAGAAIGGQLGGAIAGGSPSMQGQHGATAAAAGVGNTQHTAYQAVPLT